MNLLKILNDPYYHYIVSIVEPCRRSINDINDRAIGTIETFPTHHHPAAAGDPAYPVFKKWIKNRMGRRNELRLKNLLIKLQNRGLKKG